MADKKYSWKKKMPLDQGEQLAQKVAKVLESHGHKVAICGSIRRKKSEIGDVDIVVEGKLRTAVAVIGKNLDDVVVMSNLVTSKKTATIVVDDQQFNIVRSRPEAWGACILYLTGPMKFNILCRSLAKKAGWKLNEYGLWAGQDRIAGKTEDQIFETLGADWVPPEERAECVKRWRLPARQLVRKVRIGERK